MNYSERKASSSAAAAGETEFVEQCLRLIPLMMRAMLRRENDELTRGMVSLPQFGVLDCLHETHESTMHEIANTLRIKPSSLTGLMDRLVALKLVERFNDKTDRRVVRARITQKGEQMLARITKQKRATLGRLFRCITQGERKTYLAVMEKFIKELS